MRKLFIIFSLLIQNSDDELIHHYSHCIDGSWPTPIRLTAHYTTHSAPETRTLASAYVLTWPPLTSSLGFYFRSKLFFSLAATFIRCHWSTADIPPLLKARLPPSGCIWKSRPQSFLIFPSRHGLITI